MSKIGILAYGSLIDDPGDEIKNLIDSRIKNIETPFKIEFARSSGTRGGAPTLVPVQSGGAKVRAVVLILKDLVSEKEAKNILWRRETHKPIGSKEEYDPPATPTQNTVLVESISGFCGLKTVLYTRIAATIANPTPQKLAELAIKSAQSKKLIKGQDGISYLISAKQSGIVTPLMPDYENEILHQTKTKTLEEALAKARG